MNYWIPRQATVPCVANRKH